MRDFGPARQLIFPSRGTGFWTLMGLSSAGREPGAMRLLLVEGDASLVRRISAGFAHVAPGLDLTVAPDVRTAEALLDAAEVDGLVVSFEIDAESLRVIERLRARSSAPLIVLSSAGSVSLAVEAMRRGADDFLIKPIAPEVLVRRVLARVNDGERRAARPMGADGGLAEPAPSADADFEGFIGHADVMRAVYAQIERVAPSRAPVFVTGESGTGKEVAAEAIHRRSKRATGPFVAINCAAIPRDLMESEIFGHMRGAFTGATEDRAGAAEAASGGTLFLDEICEMDVALQAKLLRVIQTGELRRLGDAKSRAIDVRFVCATNRDPQAEIAAGRFREDLFYRLHVLPITLPPLRQRSGDVIRIARTLLKRFSLEEGRGFDGFAPEAELRLALYPWPGNVRELQNVLRRIVVLNDARFVSADMLPPELMAARAPARHAPVMEEASARRERRPDAIEPLWVQEQRIIEQAIASCGGNTARAAAALGISPSTIYRKRQAWATGTAAE
jgi:two-component system repressor protein LuxO